MNSPKKHTRFSKSLFFSLCLLTSALCYSQTWQRVSTNRNAVSWLDKKNILTVGQYGVIMKSEDTGNTWSYVHSNTTKSLFDVYFYNNQHGVAVGELGTILWTDNGGGKWNNNSLSIRNSLYAVKFYDSLHGIIVGDSGCVFLTQNGGEVWSRIESNTKNTLFSLAYVDSLVAIAVGTLGTIIQTTDGGKSWNAMNSNLTSSLYDIDFYQHKGIIVGYKVGSSRVGTILISSDKGKTWKEAEVSNLNIYPESVEILDTNRMIATGNYPRLDTFASKIIISNNGGRNWKEIRSGYTPYYYSIRDVKFNNSNRIIAVGEGCSILLSSDTGNSWIERSYTRQFDHKDLPNGNIRFSDAYFFNEMIGIIGGGNLSPGVILRTTDQGLTWETISLRQEIRSLASINEDTLIALPVKYIYNSGELFKSINQGNNWNVVDVDLNNDAYDFISSIQFLNKNEGYFSADNFIYHTFDGGKSWKSQRIPAYRGIINDFNFLNYQHGCVAVECLPETTHFDSANVRRLYRTVNSGGQWQLIKELYDSSYRRFNSVFMSNDQAIWVGYGHEVIYRKSGRIYHTIDGGNNWDSLEVEGAITDIRFFSDSLGYAVGSNALILKTVDGGKTWHREYAWPYELKDSNVVFRGTCLLPGSRTMIVYGDGVIVRGTFATPATSAPNQVRATSPFAIRILPNISTSNRRRVEIHGNDAAQRMSIYDMLGSKVYDEVVTDERWNGVSQVIDVDVSWLPSGPYRVVVATDVGSYSAPLVVLR